MFGLAAHYQSMDASHGAFPTAGVFSLAITLDQSAQPRFPHRGVRQLGYPWSTVLFATYDVFIQAWIYHSWWE